MSESLGGIILHHVTNDLNHTFLNLSLLGVNISITKHVVMIWIAAVVTVGLAIWGTRRYRKDINSLPKGISHIFEILVNFIREDIVNPNIGANHGKMWTPLITTYFIFILICNFLGMIPFFDLIPGGSSTVTGNFNATAGLASITFFAIIIAGSVTSTNPLRIINGVLKRIFKSIFVISGSNPLVPAVSRIIKFGIAIAISLGV